MALILLGGLIALVIASRLPVIGRLVRVAIWVGLFALLVVTIQHSGRFDPYVSRIVGLLRLDDQRVVGSEVRIAMAPDGHFWARARIDGVERRLLIDSGATITALSTRTAAAAGLRVGDSAPADDAPHGERNHPRPHRHNSHTEAGRCCRAQPACRRLARIR